MMLSNLPDGEKPPSAARKALALFMRYLLCLLTTPLLRRARRLRARGAPILDKHCYECHSAKKQKSGLRLDIKSEALKGGDKHAPDIVARKSADSALIKLITTADDDEVMPPKGKLPAAHIKILTRWINEGAKWPDGVDSPGPPG